MNSLIPIIILIVLSVLFFWPWGKEEKSKASYVKRYEKELLNKCFGDKEKAERLINYELRRNPNLTREDAARNASDSITRDNR